MQITNEKGIFWKEIAWVDLTQDHPDWITKTDGSRCQIVMMTATENTRTAILFENSIDATIFKLVWL